MRSITASLLLSLLFAAVVSAESGLLFAPPEFFGEIPAATYDDRGARVGSATLRVLRREDRHVVLEVTSGIDGAEQSQVSAELAPIADGSSLRLLEQHLRSFNADGTPRGHMVIDHVRREASCHPPDGTDDPVQRIELADGERIANVPLNLLFLPLIQGTVGHISFEILTCRFGPRIVSARARVISRDPARSSGDLVEIGYELDVPPLLAQLARPFLPKVAVWFDRASQGEWVGHRMPLFLDGPTLTVVRGGFAPVLLGTGE